MEKGADFTVEMQPVQPQLVIKLARFSGSFQPHGVVLVYDKIKHLFIYTTDNIHKILGIDPNKILNNNFDFFLNADHVQQIKNMEHREQSFFSFKKNDTEFYCRALCLQNSIVVEFEPEKNDTLPSFYDHDFNVFHEEFLQSQTINALARTATRAFAQITGFGVVSLAQSIDEHPRILGESSDQSLPSLFGHERLAKSLIELVGLRPYLKIPDVSVGGARLLTIDDQEAAYPILDESLFLILPPTITQQLRDQRTCAILVMPLYLEQGLWGHVICRNWREYLPFTAQIREAHRFIEIIAHHIARIAAEELARTVQSNAAMTERFHVICQQTSNPIGALLFGPRLLFQSSEADGAAIISGSTIISIGYGPGIDHFLPKILTKINTQPLNECFLLPLPASIPPEYPYPGMTPFGNLNSDAADGAPLPQASHPLSSPPPGYGDALVLLLQRAPLIALVVFKQRDHRRIAHLGDDALKSVYWSPAHRNGVETLGTILRQTLPKDATAAASNLHTQILSTRDQSIVPEYMRTTILNSALVGLALLTRIDKDGAYQLDQMNTLFRRLFGLQHQTVLRGTLKDLGYQLGLDPDTVGSPIRHGRLSEIWSSELGPRIIRTELRPIVRTLIDGHYTSILLFQVTDVSDMHRHELAMHMAQDQALALIQMRDEMLANMSHELRTPLNAIIGFADMINQQVLGPINLQRYVSYAADIEFAGRHLLGLINDVLDLSKQATGRQSTNEEPVALIRLLKSCIKWAEAAHPGRLITLTVNGDRSELVFLCEERALRQVVINLISNALKFSNHEDPVQVRILFALHTVILIDVIDQGIGMNQNEILRAFEPFFRGGGAYQRRIEGAGLGLAIAKGLIDLHGGSLTLTSLEGQGTTARIELPAWRVLSDTET